MIAGIHSTKKMVVQYGHITQEEAEILAMKAIQRMKEANCHPDEILEAEMQIVGGACPMCRRPWERITGLEQTKLSYYAPTCVCLQARREKLTKEQIEARELEKTYKEANFPKSEWGSEWNNWDYRVSQQVKEAMTYCYDYSRFDGWASGDGLILYGAVGTGKTRCAIMILKEIAKRKPGAKVLFLPMADLASLIIRNQTDNGFIANLERYTAIAVDDMDKIPADREWMRGQVFSFYDTILRNNITMIGTTNLTGESDMRAKFDDAVVSRIAGRCQFVQFPGGREDDYRMIKRNYEK